MGALKVVGGYTLQNIMFSLEFHYLAMAWGGDIHFIPVNIVKLALTPPPCVHSCSSIDVPLLQTHCTSNTTPPPSTVSVVGQDLYTNTLKYCLVVLALKCQNSWSEYLDSLRYITLFSRLHTSPCSESWTLLCLDLTGRLGPLLRGIILLN